MYESILKILERNLNEKRFIHSLNTANEAKKLAGAYNENPEKAYFTGLIHDCTKNTDIKKQLDMIKKFNTFPLYEKELENPNLIHAVSGAVYAQREFGVSDRQILSAVRYHTLGRINMTPLEKIIYIADLIEPGRSFHNIERLRQEAYKNLNRAIILSIDNTIAYLSEKKQEIQKEAYALKLNLEKSERIDKCNDVSRKG